MKRLGSIQSMKERKGKKMNIERITNITEHSGVDKGNVHDVLHC